jgi:hypothetical protein
MSPKKKAIELVEKFNFICHIDSDGFTDYYETKHNREQCALILCNELISHSRNTAMVYDLSFDESENYWTKVKKEIEKL